MKVNIVLSMALLGLTSHLAVAQTQVQPPARPYSVLSYDLLLDWRNVFEQQTQIFSGRNEIQVILTDTTSFIVLDASEMSIDSVSIDGQLIGTPTIKGDTVAIPLTPAERVKGSRLTLDVSYTRTSSTDDGMNFYPKGLFVGFGPVHDSVFVEENLAYTMSEPQDAHKWMPCNDNPYNKANSAISIIVPAEYSAQSNGTLQSVDTNADGSLTFNWESDRPIATYLMCADASKWIQWQDYYHRVTNSADSVPVVYFAWPPDYYATDTTGLAHNAHYAFRNTPKMIEADSKLFGEYPFKQYGQVPLQPFGYGGMEHQTMTSLDRSILHGTNEDVIAHELFHQWFGDKTTCETWADIWLNEGFATFGEALWEESAHGHDAYDNVILQKASEFFNPRNGYVTNAPTYNPPVGHMFDTYALLVYNKPGCVLHTLRRMLNNDTLFFNTLRDYSSAFAYTTANTFQFRDFIAQRDSAVAPMDLKEFINEWIFQPDYPVYNIDWTFWAQPTNLKDSTYLQIDVSQSQDSTDHYTMPLRFKAVSDVDTTDLVFLNDQRSQSFGAWLNWKDGRAHGIASIIFDQNAIPISNVTITALTPLLKVQQDDATTAGFLQAKLVDESLKLDFAPVVSENAQIELLDLLGRVISRSNVPFGQALLVLSTHGISSGNYFVRLHDGARVETVKFDLEK
jgi:aminopeptidase N